MSASSTGPEGGPGAPRRTPEELANVLTHGVGLVAAVAGAVVLILLAALGGDAWKITGVSVFAASLVTLYGASTLYHAARRPGVKSVLRVVDHAAIFLLIAGTYTPFLIGVLRGAWGWTLFGVIWGLAVVGIGLKVAFIGRFRLVSTLVYLGMGWLVVFAAGPLLRELDPATLWWIAAGGLAYTAGTPFYHSARLRHAHAVWHLFVLAGSTCHAVAVATIL